MLPESIVQSVSAGASASVGIVSIAAALDER